MGDITEKKKGNLRKSKWDWTTIENLILAGKTNREICDMPEFKGLSYEYLKNRAAKLGLHSKREEVKVLAAGGVNSSIAERRTEGIEKHHVFTFEQLDKMRKAILEHKVKGSVKDLREMMSLFQSYIDAAEQSYGLKGQDMDQRAISLNAMVSLHIKPPARDFGPNITGNMVVEEVRDMTGTLGNGLESIEAGAESGGSDPDSGAEG